MSVFTELHSKTVATEGGVDGRSMRPASDSTARNALTSEALQDPLIPEHHGQKTCRVGLAGIHPASRPGFYGIRTEREKNGIKDVILRISFRHRLSHRNRHRNIFLSTLYGYDRSASSPFYHFSLLIVVAHSKRGTHIDYSKHVLKFQQKNI